MSAMIDINALNQEMQDFKVKGWIPEWYTLSGWQIFRAAYWVKAEEAVRGRFETIARVVARHLPFPYNAHYEKKFFNEMWEGRLSPSSPVLANTGTARGDIVSCSGQFIGDSVKSFYLNLFETAILSKRNYGTSWYGGAIRPRGSKFGESGKANGQYAVIEDFFTCTEKISQGGLRKGAGAANIPLDSPDFYECLWALKKKPKGKNFAWIVSDKVTELLKQGDPEMGQRWKDALHVKILTGKGYLFFVDKANRHRPQMYKDLGLDIVATNLCVAPETVILTDRGYVQISTLVNQEVNVWNGTEFSKVTVKQTGTNQKLITVTTDSGFELDCTPYHRFYVQTGYDEESVVMKQANELVEGDRLIKLDTPVIEGSIVFSDAYQNGFYSGDGCTVTTNCNTKHRIYLYGTKRELIGMFPVKEQHYIQENQDREYFNVASLQDKYTVPTAQNTIESRLQWLAGYLDADGTVARNGDSQSLQVASTNPLFLRELQLMLQTLGVQSKITPLREAGIHPLPSNDGTGGNTDYYCKAIERLLIGGVGVYDLLQLGLQTHRLQISSRKPQRNAARFVKVSSVTDHGRIDDTYCFNEPKKHLGVFNGLLTGQCTEIMLHSSEELTYSCVLASMNAVHWDTIQSTDSVRTATVFLDCVISEYLESSKGIEGLEKIHAFTEKGRAIGLGWLGVHTYLQKEMIPYSSLDAQHVNYKMYKHLHDESLKASQWLAELLGEPEWCKGYGVRNTHRTAQAPNKTTASLMGVSESNVPEPAMVYASASIAGEVDQLPVAFKDFLIAKGQYTPEVIQSVIANLGSVQHLDWMTPHEKAVFRNAFEEDQWIILRRAKQRQKWLCQGQSLNFFISEETREQSLTDLLSACVLEEDILSVYYGYFRSGVVVLDECINCQA